MVSFNEFQQISKVRLTGVLYSDLQTFLNVTLCEGSRVLSRGARSLAVSFVEPVLRMELNDVWLFIIGEANAVFEELTAPWFETRLPPILSNYSLANIYNADEFGLFYQALPSKTTHFKREKCVGGKFSKRS